MNTASAPLRLRFWALVIASLLPGCRAEPDDVGAIVTARTLGLIHLQESRLPEAEAAFRTLVRLAPNEVAGYANLALVHLRMGGGKLDEAEGDIGSALALDPSNLDLHLIQAKAWELTGRQDRARTELERLLGRDSAAPRLLYALAELSNGPDGGTRRAEYLRRLVAARPANVPARVLLAETLAALGDADGTVRELEALRQVPPAPPISAAQPFQRALDAARQGRAADAVEPLHRYRAVVEVTGTYQSALFDLLGPQGPLAGVPTVAFPPVYVLRTISRGDAVTEEVTFADLALRTGRYDGLAVADVDGDGRLEILLGGERTTLLRLPADGTAPVDIAEESGLQLGRVHAARFGDFDNDGHLDVATADTKGVRLLRNDGQGRFEDVTGRAGIATAPTVRRILFADLDHDGDLDLLLATGNGLRLYRNNLDGTFADAGAQMGLVGSIAVNDVAMGDFDGDGQLDLVTVGEDGVSLFQNTSLRRFVRRTTEAGLPVGGNLTGVAVGDYDNDGTQDLLLMGAAGASLYQGMPGGTFRADDRSTVALPSLAGAGSATFIDYDNDGFLDLLGGRRPGDGGAVLLRNDGTGRFLDRSTLLPTNLGAITGVAAADLDGDRDLDLVLSGPGGTRLLRNDGGNLNVSVQVRLAGLTTGSGKNNTFGVGTRIELRAGDLYQSRVVTEPVTHFGLGRHLKADVLRIEWPNGVPQTLYYPGSDTDVLEDQVLKSSCAFLYAWDGTGFRFVTDVMWQSALGMPVGIGGSGSATYAPPGPSREYIRIPDNALVARDGRFTIQWTEELWETSYTDELRLVAVDHPDSVDVRVDERFVPPGGPGRLTLHSIVGTRPPTSAVDGEGRDVLERLRERDDRFVDDMTPTRYQGVMGTHQLILDVGPVPAEGRHLLLLSGWIFPPDASINVALAQTGSLTVTPPLLEARDAAGRWRTAVGDMGFPSGKNKTVVVDLTGLFPTQDHHVRIRTNMQIYWDQAVVATGLTDGSATSTPLKPGRADLHERGFSQMFRKGGRYGPHWFDYDQVSKESPWRPITGMLTRLGDVTALLQASDDEYVVMGPGDELTVDFEAAALPPLPTGWRRDLLLYSVGWIKDGDLNTAHGGTVTPLPFHAMSAYPYPDSEAYSEHGRFIRTFQTRRTGLRTKDFGLR